MNLTISMIDTQEPVLVLEDTDFGVQAVGGDPRYIEALGLNQFRTLKDIADYINGAGQGFQATFDELNEGNQAPEEDTLDDRLKPALEILKQMMSRVKQRQNQDKAEEEAKKPEAQMLQSDNTQVIQGETGHIYVSIDGDNIGNKIAQAEELDDERTLSEISARINAGQQVLENFARKMGGKVVEAGGDEGLIKVPANAKDHLEELKEEYRNIVGATCTIGVGRKISESTKARMLGKLTGKNKIVVFDESTAKELEIRLEQDKSKEGQKMRVAMRSADSLVNQQPQVPQSQPQQTEAQPSPEQPQEEQQPQAPRMESRINPELAKAAGQLPIEEGPERDPMGSRDYDQQLESDDYSEYDDPDFIKRLRYMNRYGRGDS